MASFYNVEWTRQEDWGRTELARHKGNKCQNIYCTVFFQFNQGLISIRPSEVWVNFDALSKIFQQLRIQHLPSEIVC